MFFFLNCSQLFESLQVFFNTINVHDKLTIANFRNIDKVTVERKQNAVLECNAIS